jgi:hypothetical protein
MTLYEILIGVSFFLVKQFNCNFFCLSDILLLLTVGSSFIDGVKLLENDALLKASACP